MNSISKDELLVTEGSIFYRCVEHSYDAIMITDIQGVILYVNRAFEEMYGYLREQTVGKTPRLLRSGLQAKEVYSQMWREILDPNKGYWKGELINRAKDGTAVPVLLTITPFKDEKNEVKGYMSVGLDMREKKRMEAQLLQQDRLASIGLLASGLAHEVGTPLGVIRGRAEYLLMNPGKPDPRSLEIIVSQIDRISKLIYSLLNLAHASHSGTVVPVNLAHVLNEVVNLVGQSLKKNTISFETNVTSHIRVKAEADRLEQVLLNLVMNSIHAIEVAIGEGRKNNHRIEVKAQSNADQWEITVADTGCGITEENMNHLFKPFFTTKEVGSGTGLGLVICQQIVQSWGGRLWAESRFGVESTFRLLLPKG